VLADEQHPDVIITNIMKGDIIGLPISVPMAAARKLPPITQQMTAAIIRCSPSMG